MSAKTSGAARIDELTEEVRALEETIVERSRVLEDKKKEHDADAADYEEAKKAADEAEQRLAVAQEQFRVADQTRTMLLPQYERCQQHRDQHKKAEEFKKEIAQTETSMRDADTKIKTLEERLQKVSAEYKAEREKRCLLADRVLTMLDELRLAVEEKVTLTLPIDESTVTPHARTSFKAICENAREREVAIAQCARHAAEISAVVRMKQQRVQELRVEAERDIATLKAVKDAQIKRMVLQFDEERRSIQDDIDAVENANAELQRQLRNTRHSHADAANSSMAGGTSRRDSARPASASVAKRTKELEQERGQLQAQVQSAATERKQLVATMRALNARIQQKEADHQRAMQALEAQMHRDRNTALHYERENRRLEETCDAMITSIQAAKQSNAIADAPARQQ
jgi:chromosome segregation ATPase